MKNKEFPKRDSESEQSDRKTDHIDLAVQSSMNREDRDHRFEYEPLFAGHPDRSIIPSVQFGKKTLRVPLWVSSMTGGTKEAGMINRNLAKVCRRFGMGMGLGSCRALLEDDQHFEDFDLREVIGPECPLFANLGIAQVEELVENEEVDRIGEMIEKLQADGLIIHINPLQEWLQPEGDRFRRAPFHTITDLLDAFEHPLIVKEVGQGMGKESLRGLLNLPLLAVEFAAHGGTNFARLEMMRGPENRKKIYRRLATLGHSAFDMARKVNVIQKEDGKNIRCQNIIASGGVKDFLDGFYLTKKISMPSIYGQASAFLKHARTSYDEVEAYTEAQIEGLALAHAYLRVK